jgi:hypothetical protein
MLFKLRMRSYEERSILALALTPVMPVPFWGWCPPLVARGALVWAWAPTSSLRR